MAIGTIFFTLPVTILVSIWVAVLHGLNALQTLGVYSAFGSLTLMVVFVTALLALRDIREV
ncbi:MAG: hypothetical protein KJN60_11850 [Boseongicola sp.]|nr:hypothetical protein [Boseongicola sp.]